MDKEAEAGIRMRECRPWENDRWPDGNVRAGAGSRRAGRPKATVVTRRTNRGSRVDRSALRQQDGWIAPAAQLHHVPHGDADARGSKNIASSMWRAQ
jgi:hypothetical protein